jgi:catechol 2,3-dioxygenase-like lactoylglutathione lyase family enzyme
MPETLVDSPVKFHISLNVANLDASVDFYRALLGVEPAKCRPDYAKFEPAEPPLVLSLEPGGRAPGGNLNHVGLRFADSESLVEAQRRLEAAGLKTNREEGVECCYARQTKFWVHDPDRTLWEIYVLEGDIEHRGDGQSAEHFHPPQASMAEEPRMKTKWEHRFGDAIPGSIDAGDDSLDVVQLQGTFNRPVSADERSRFLLEIQRKLRPGGELHIRNLVSDRPLPPGPPNLPGPAAVVEAVPTEQELMAAVEAAGFDSVEMIHFDGNPCFTKGDASMRQLRLTARRSQNGGGKTDVMYRGPFKEIADDSGRAFRRGMRVSVPTAVAEQLRTGAMSSQFVVFDAVSAGSCG